jgi:hypothetical protein
MFAGPNRNLDVLTELLQGPEHSLDRKAGEAALEQVRNSALAYAEHFRGLTSTQAAGFNQRGDFDGEPGFEESLLGVGESKIGKDIARSHNDADITALTFAFPNPHIALLLLPLQLRNLLFQLPHRHHQIRQPSQRGLLPQTLPMR